MLIGISDRHTAFFVYVFLAFWIAFCSLSSVAHFFIAARSVSGLLFKIHGEVAEIIVSAQFAYFKDRVTGTCKKSFCHFYAVEDQILMQSCSEGSLHKSVEMVWVVSENLR